MSRSIFRFAAAVALLLTGRTFAASGHEQRADIEFAESPHFIAIEIKDEGASSKMGFRLTTNDNTRSVSISDCLYEEAALKREIVNIQDPAVRSAFGWIFFRSGRSPVVLDRFYPQFQQMLERTLPSCKVMPLPVLLEKLQSLKG